MAIRTSEEEKKRQEKQEESKAKRQKFWAYTKVFLIFGIKWGGAIVIIAIVLFLVGWKGFGYNVLGEFEINFGDVFLILAIIFWGIALLCRVGIANFLYYTEHERDTKYPKSGKKGESGGRIRKRR